MPHARGSDVWTRLLDFLENDGQADGSGKYRLRQHLLSGLLGRSARRNPPRAVGYGDRRQPDVLQIAKKLGEPVSRKVRCYPILLGLLLEKLTSGSITVRLRPVAFQE